jgi:hypothetical protein
MLYGSLGMHANTLRNCSCCPPQFLCTLHVVRPPQIHTVRPVLPCCLKSILLFALGCMLSFSKCCLFSQLDLSLALWHLTKDLTLASHQRSLLLASHQESLLLASHQESLDLGISPKIRPWHLTKGPLSCSLLFSQQECCNFLVLGISPRTSWHLTKSLLLSQQDCCCLPKNGCALLP